MLVWAISYLCFSRLIVGVLVFRVRERKHAASAQFIGRQQIKLLFKVLIVYRAEIANEANTLKQTDNRIRSFTINNSILARRRARGEAVGSEQKSEKRARCTSLCIFKLHYVSISLCVMHFDGSRGNDSFIAILMFTLMITFLIKFRIVRLRKVFRLVRLVWAIESRNGIKFELWLKSASFAAFWRNWYRTWNCFEVGWALKLELKPIGTSRKRYRNWNFFKLTSLSWNQNFVNTESVLNQYPNNSNLCFSCLRFETKSGSSTFIFRSLGWLDDHRSFTNSGCKHSWRTSRTNA